MPCTFQVCDISGRPTRDSRSNFIAEMSASDFAASKTSVLGKSSGACHGRSKLTKDLVIPRLAPFVHAMDVAFNHHLPLELSPDGVLLVIAQHFSKHMNDNSEKYRETLVAHKGKETITIRDDSLIKNSLDNDWEPSFAAFSEQIQKRIPPKIHAAIVADFSTTGPVQKACSEIVLMESVQKYFNYHQMTRCGIPEVTLMGSKEDWVHLQNKIEGMRGFDLDEWIDDLRVIVQHCIDSFDGKVDKTFWNSIYHYGSGSGGPHVSGWVQVLYGFSSLNDALAGHGQLFEGRSPGDFPIGRSQCPVLWTYYQEEIKCVFIAGFVGTGQNPKTNAVKAEMGWEVVEDQ